MSDKVILVDISDTPIAAMDKLEAHQKGLLHRAFSIFIFNDKKEFLLQKRASDKYHSPDLWTNTCCSHPRPEEDLLSAANRRLKEEMGMTTALKTLYSFIYKIDFSNGLSEHELDHVVIGFSEDAPVPDVREASDWKYMAFGELQKEITLHPEAFTEWFKLCYEKTFSMIQHITV